MEKKRNKIWPIVLSVLTAGGIVIYKAFANKGPAKYSRKWIESLNDDEWAYEREKARKIMCSPKYEESVRETFRRFLDLFDKVKNERDWGGRTDYGYPVKRDWHLPSDD